MRRRGGRKNKRDEERRDGRGGGGGGGGERDLVVSAIGGEDRQKDEAIVLRRGDRRQGDRQGNLDDAPIGVGNNGSIDPFPLDDPLSSKPRIIGSYRDELSSRILTPSETITFAIPPFLGNVMLAVNARGVARSSLCALQSTPQSSLQSASSAMVLPL
jgi:hypothetical protein